jgi:hypothetical protein
MRRMLDMIRSSSVSATVMQAAARGALAVPGAEMIEILVYITNHNKVFGQQARMTLAGWELKSSLEAASSPATPPEVLDYLIAPENLRPPLLPALLENPSVKQEALLHMAANGSREVVDAMRKSSRVQGLSEILRALAANPNSTPIEVAQFQQAAVVPEELSQEELPEAPPHPPDGSAIHLETSDENVLEENVAVDVFLTEHARELSLEGEKPFQPLGGFHEFEVASLETSDPVEEPKAESVPPAETGQTPAVATGANPSGAATATATRTSPAAKKAHSSQEAERGSALQKISRLDIKGRIQLAMKGTKEDRSILIRDSTKLVALAVLESPKVTDGEVEKFANQKNVLEAVLRQIPMKRRFVKNYGVVRNLVANPRTPLDVSLGLMKNLLTADLKNLAGNKEVSDTIRKLATKMFKQKMDTTKK